jgi:hypothetical protein
VLPLALLLGFGVAFAGATLGGAMLGFDDHPGQLYRLWHVLTYGPAPWAWDRGWWAGYPELQFYPPGFAYLGALLAWATAGVLDMRTVYQGLLWVAYLLPGVTAYVALMRLTGQRWMALPFAFVALTLSAGLASGVNGGVRTGMVGARLAWALLPLLLALLARWIEERRPLSPVAALLLAAITLLHPAQLPAAVVLIALATLLRAPWRASARDALKVLGLAAALTGFWTLPLLFRLAETRALAWGTLSLRDFAHPIPIILAALAIAGLIDRAPSGAGARLALWWMPATVVMTALDRGALEPLGLRWLPADRVVDGAWMALLLAAGVAAVRLARRLETRPFIPLVGVGLRAPVLGIGAAALFALLSIRGDTLMLRPGAAIWPSLISIERGLRMPDLWSLLGRLPEGRILFVRSGVPLVHGVDWWRPHTHVTALAPAEADRDIVHGTFTHPSPIAAFVYRGDAGRGAITELAEELDGHSLFGESLDTLDADRFSMRANRLGVVAVVALEDDVIRLAWVTDNTPFSRRLSLSPFVVFARESPVALPAARDGGGRVALTGAPGGWTSARVAYYPLWRAESDGAALQTRRGEDGLLEVRMVRTSQTVTLRYGPGAPEIAGVALSTVALAAWAVLAWKSA